MEKASTTPKLTLTLLCLLAFTAGLSVAGNYYNQALLGVLKGAFQRDAGTIVLVPMATQAANALGIMLLAPLGDMVERKRLLVIMLCLSSISLISAGSASTFPWLVMASVAVGLGATVTQQVIPLAVQLADPANKARALGVVTGCIFTGILVARTFAGLVSDGLGWRWVFWIAGGMTAMAAFGLLLTLPRVSSPTRLPYGAIMGSLWGLWRAHRELRVVTIIHGLVFAAFLGFWTTLALHLQREPFGFSASAVGWIALLGAVGALVAPFAGRAADRLGADRITYWALWGLAASFAIFAVSSAWLAGLLFGVMMLDMAVQASQVANQTRALAIDAEARSRLNTLFMAGAIAGGAAGAAASGLAFAQFGWRGTCLFGAACAALGIAAAAAEKPSSLSRSINADDAK